MSVLGSFADMEQDDKIRVLERRIHQLERKINGGNGMSGIIKGLIGQDCTLKMDYEDVKCRITDADEEWVKLLVYGKKGDKSVIKRIDAIDEIIIDQV